MAVVANFNHSAFPTGSLTVIFEDTSTGNPDMWFWDFGDGATSLLQNPQHTFDSPLSFAVTLKVWVNESTGSGSMGQPATSSIKSQVNTLVHDMDTVWAFISSGGGYGSTSLQRIAYLFQRWGSDPGTNANYIAYRYQFLYTPPVSNRVTSYIQATFFETDDFSNLNRTIQTSGSSLLLKAMDPPFTTSLSDGTLIGRRPASVSGTVQFSTHTRRGETTVWKFWPDYVRLDGGGEAVNVEGFMCKDISIVEHTAVFGEHDEITKSVLIGYVPPPEVMIDFVGTPLLGTSPMEVDFTDLSNVQTVFSRWEFGDGNAATFAGTTNPTNTYISDHCSIAAE
jgi:PKD repeat protein